MSESSSESAGFSRSYPDPNDRTTALRAMSKALLELLNACRAAQAGWENGETVPEDERTRIRNLTLHALADARGIHVYLTPYTDDAIRIENRIHLAVRRLLVTCVRHIAEGTIPTTEEAHECSKAIQDTRDVWLEVGAASTTERGQKGEQGDLFDYEARKRGDLVVRIRIKRCRGSSTIDVAEVSGPSLVRMFELVRRESEARLTGALVPWRDLQQAWMSTVGWEKRLTKERTLADYSRRIRRALEAGRLASFWRHDTAQGCRWR